MASPPPPSGWLDVTEPVPVGWRCLLCRRVYSPAVSECPRCTGEMPEGELKEHDPFPFDFLADSLGKEAIFTDWHNREYRATVLVLWEGWKKHGRADLVQDGIFAFLIPDIRYNADGHRGTWRLAEPVEGGETIP